MTKKLEVLKNYFGYKEFRVGQSEVIDQILAGRDVLCIMPTGAGKSICYQIPALMSKGITIIVSPLISLMQDQVHKLIDAGISAAYINSSLPPDTTEKVLRNLADLKYKIIYVAPERLLSGAFMDIVYYLNISLLVVDEAHCISKWGHDFRQSYLNIIKFINFLRYRPTIAAFTATATIDVENDIVLQLGLKNAFIKKNSFDRKNLYLEVRYPKEKKKELIKILKDKQDQAGIVYCGTRKNVEEVYTILVGERFSVTKYHAGMNDEERKNSQRNFLSNEKKIMIATNAFGMGIDKSDIRYVIHYNMPKDLESYYQEIGRAGRDGKRADCVLLFNNKDIYFNQRLIKSGVKDIERIKIEYKLLHAIINYCKTNNCLRGTILDYFGEKFIPPCKNCYNCCEDNFEFKDVTYIAKTIIGCISHLQIKYGKNMLVTILKGGKNEKIFIKKLSDVDEYGRLKMYTRDYISEIIQTLIQQGYVGIQGDDYPVLTVIKNIGENKIYLKTRKGHSRY